MSINLDEFIEKASAIIGATRVLTEPLDTEGYQRDWRDRYRGHAIAVLLPGSTEEVSRLIRLCSDMDVAVVPQAGNTGLTGGAIASDDRPTVILNVSRLNRVREIDVRNNSITVESGFILENLRSVANENNRLFPMLLGSVGSCEVGGLVSTNAGGTGVLRYGNMRELILGLEVVLPDGSIWDGLRSLRKDSTGYDLKQLFIGAEGTLGIVTAAVLKLFPINTSSATAMVALDSVGQAVDLLRFLQEEIGNRIEAFEIMSKNQVEIVIKHGHDIRSPMELTSPWYVLIEIADSAKDWDPVLQIGNSLEIALERELITDAVVATDETKALKIWELRHNISETNKKAGFTVSNDTSVPISQLPKFIDTVTHRITNEIEAATVCHAGHIGDGNIHVIALLSRDAYQSPEACESSAAKVNLIVHEESVTLNGSISAEHGIGKMHIDRLARFKPELDLSMMKTIKKSFDPKNIMNPNKIFRA